jgi:hypothetical protein
VRAELNIERQWTHREIERAHVHAHLHPPRLESLWRASVVYCRGRNIVIQGQQRAESWKRNTETTYGQMWWCKIVQQEGAEDADR